MDLEKEKAVGTEINEEKSNNSKIDTAIYPNYYAMGPKPPPLIREPFTTEKSDVIFALVCYVLGYMVVRWADFTSSGWTVTLYTLLFVLGVGWYAKAKKVKPSKESWYWLGITCLTGISYALWPAQWLSIPRSLLLLGSMAYWCAVLFNVLLQGKTSNFLPLDGINFVVLLPLYNYDLTKRTFTQTFNKKTNAKQVFRSVFPVILGLVLCLPILAVIIPLLANADTQLFKGIFIYISESLRYINFMTILRNVLPWLLAIPLGLYLYWQLAGAAHKRYNKNIDVVGVRRSASTLAQAPKSTVLVVLWVVSLVYIVFVACQLPYFFSGFSGAKPQQYSLYSEYARQGFFELCRIAAINLVILGVGNIFCRTTIRESKALRFANLMLCVLTLLLIATAFSKMALYIHMHGLTPKRVSTSVFMLFLAGVWIAVMVLQFKTFSILRFVSLFGSGLFCLLLLCNMDGQIARYNSAHYQNEGIRTYYDLITWRGGLAGVKSAIEIYNEIDGKANPEEKERMEYLLVVFAQEAYRSEGTSQDTLTHAQARNSDWPAPVKNLINTSSLPYQPEIYEHYWQNSPT